MQFRFIRGHVVPIRESGDGPSSSPKKATDHTQAKQLAKGTALLGAGAGAALEGGKQAARLVKAPQKFKLQAIHSLTVYNYAKRNADAFKKNKQLPLPGLGSKNPERFLRAAKKVALRNTGQWRKSEKLAATFHKPALATATVVGATLGGAGAERIAQALGANRKERTVAGTVGATAGTALTFAQYSKHTGQVGSLAEGVAYLLKDHRAIRAAKAIIKGAFK